MILIMIPGLVCLFICIGETMKDFNEWMNDKFPREDSEEEESTSTQEEEKSDIERDAEYAHKHYFTFINKKSKKDDTNE
jgi:hypothetical protein